MGIRIIGTGMYVPERILTNADLEKMVDTSDEWITTRTGIKERRIADAETATSDLALQAARNALQMADVPASSLDLIIVATVTPDKVFPSTACLLQTKLGAPACALTRSSVFGLLYAIEVAHAMLAASPNYRRATVSAPKTVRHHGLDGSQHLRHL